MELEQKQCHSLEHLVHLFTQKKSLNIIVALDLYFLWGGWQNIQSVEQMALAVRKTWRPYKDIDSRQSIKFSAQDGTHTKHIHTHF